MKASTPRGPQFNPELWTPGAHWGQHPGTCPYPTWSFTVTPKPNLVSAVARPTSCFVIPSHLQPHPGFGPLGEACEFDPQSWLGAVTLTVFSHTGLPGLRTLISHLCGIWPHPSLYPRMVNMNTVCLSSFHIRDDPILYPPPPPLLPSLLVPQAHAFRGLPWVSRMAPKKGPVSKSVPASTCPQGPQAGPPGPPMTVSSTCICWEPGHFNKRRGKKKKQSSNFGTSDAVTAGEGRYLGAEDEARITPPRRLPALPPQTDSLDWNHPPFQGKRGVQGSLLFS